VNRKAESPQEWLLDQSEAAFESNGQSTAGNGHSGEDAARWLVAPAPGAPAPTLDQIEEEPRESEGTEENGAAPDQIGDLGELEQLAQIQRIEISVLVRRVEELESELAAAKRDAASAKGRATRAERSARKGS
jgi:hypothetical protein